MSKSNNHNYADDICLIKKEIEEKRLSLIIGAGFSKNISKELFLNWKELLVDMIKEMYPDEIDLSKNVDNEIDKIINKIGYLEIASEYIRRKGYREAIDAYIEKKIPYLKYDDKDKMCLWIGNEHVCSVLESGLDVHKKLIELRIKSIYTFNYDNALEIIDKTDKTSELWEQEAEIQKNQDALKKEYNVYETFINELISVSNNQTLFIKNGGSISGYKNQTDKLINEINDFINKLKNIKFLNINIDSINDDIKKNKEEYKSKKYQLEVSLKKIESQRENKYHLIDESSKISITDQYNSIFKLHGTHRLVITDHKYKFDNDLRKQYVICKEDYETYPIKHDAFASLMKISLLKGSFCLIGFSGDDPNFLQWMSWVREVSRGQKKKNGEIFFIDVSCEPLSNEKQLLFKNHHIRHIPLSEIYEGGDSNKLISQFLDDISTSLTYANKYTEAWSKININSSELNSKDIKARFNINLKPINNVNVIDTKAVNDLWTSFSHNKMPKLKSSGHQREEVLLSIKYILENNLMTEDIAKIIYIAFIGELLPLYSMINLQLEGGVSEIEKFNKQISNFSDIVKLYEVLETRSKVLLNIHEYEDVNDSPKTFESCYSYLFNLNFSKAKNTIDLWMTDELWTPKRFALLSIFTRENSEQYTKCISPDHYKYLQDYIYGVDIISGIRNVLYNSDKGFLTSDYDIKETRDNVLLKNPHLNRLWDNIDYLIKELKLKKEQINPLGNATTTSTWNKWNYSVKYSIQLLQTFIEIGMPMQSINRSHLNKLEWFVVFKNIYKIYPYPCIYFSLQFGGDTSFVKRIAQEYVSSPDISLELLSDLLVKMMKALTQEETPYNIKQGIYVMAPIFMSRVEYKEWGKYFEDFYSEFDFTKIDCDLISIEPVYNFIIIGVKCSDSSFKTKTLMNILKSDKIDDFYNSLLISTIKNSNLNIESTEVTSAIDDLLLKSEEPTHFFVLMNLCTYKILNNYQKKLLIEKLTNYDYFSNPNKALLQAGGWFSKGHIEYQKKIEHSIVKSSFLWKTGITKAENNIISRSLDVDWIDINTIQDNIVFSNENILIMYIKLKEAFADIVLVVDLDMESEGHNSIFTSHWGQILMQMRVFLVKNKKILSKQSDYRTIVKKVNLYYGYQSKVFSILDALTSENQQRVNNATNRLFYDCKIYGVKKYRQEYITIAQMITLKNNAGLKNCITHFCWILSGNYKDFNKTIFKPFVKTILEQYSNYFKAESASEWNLDAEKDIIEKSLIELNCTYKKWGGNSEFWNNYQAIFINNRQS